MTDNFKLECKNPAYANRLGKITYGNDLSINEDDYLVDFETTDDCYLDGNIIGTTNAKSITINTLDNYELVDGDVNVSVGVKYDDDTTEYINLGKYTIQRENNQQTSQNGQYTGMDYLSKLDSEYVCGITDWTNKTLSDVYSDSSILVSDELSSSLRFIRYLTAFLHNSKLTSGFTPTSTARLCPSSRQVAIFPVIYTTSPILRSSIISFVIGIVSNFFTVSPPYGNELHRTGLPL